MIVPRTTELITQDQDYALFNVTLFQKTEDTFRHKCRENKYVEFLEKINRILFVFKDLLYEILRLMKKHLQMNVTKFGALEVERQKLYANLVRWLKIHFGEKSFQH